MATSPRVASPASPVATGNLEADTKVFGEEINRISTAVDALFKLALAVGTLKKGEKLQLPDGSLVGRREARSALSAVQREVLFTKKMFKAGLRAKKRPAVDPVTGQPVKRGGGFSLPIRITDALANFFATANLGPLDPMDAARGPLAPHLQLLTQNHITSPSLLTPLFSIYAIVNNLQDPTNLAMLHADQHMMNTLGETLRTLQATIQPHLSKPSKTGRATRELPGFDPNNFPYSYLQNIIAANKVAYQDDAARKADQKALIANPEVMARLAQEQQLVSATLAVYRDLRKPQDQARRKLKRQQKAAATRAAAGRA